MIWLQEFGNAGGANRADYKLFYCETDGDVSSAPTLTTSGVLSDFAPGSATTDADPVKIGDQILIWGTGDLKTMMPDGSWKSVGE